MKKLLMLFLMGMLLVGMGSAFYDKCYQESFNTTNQVGTDGNCSLNYGGYSGYMTIAGVPATTFTNLGAVLDGNWSSYSQSGDIFSNIYYSIHYLKPSGGMGAILRVKTNGTDYNVTLPGECFNHTVSASTTNQIRLIYHTNGGAMDISCEDNLNVDVDHTDRRNIFNMTSNDSLYEEGIYWTPGIVENPQTWNPETLIGSNQTFTVNVTYNSVFYTSISANLIYNGTSYLGIPTAYGNDVIFSKSINVPESIGNKSFYWAFTLTNSSGGLEYFNSSTKYQNVLSALFTICNASYPQKGINFTVYNESNPTGIITASLKATFEYGTQSYKYGNVSYVPADNSTFTFCIYPNDTSMYVNSYLKLSATGFYDKIYSFTDDLITNLTTYRSLYMMPVSDGRAVIIEVRDPTYQALANYTVKVYRKDISTGQYLFVASDVTDIYGQIVTTMTESTVKYQLKFYDADNVLQKTTSDLTVACRTSVCILPFVITPIITDFDRFKNVTGYTHSLTFNNNTNLFTLSWNDNTGASGIIHRLQVTRYNDTVDDICDTTSNALIGTLTCSVGSSKASYTAQAYRDTNDLDERRIDVLSVMVGDTSHIFGVEGLIWSFILLMTCCAIGFWYPPVGAGLFAVGFLILGFMGVIFVNPAIYAAVIVICGIFAYAFRG